MRRLAGAFLIAALLAGLAAWIAVQNLTHFARWAMERAFPGAQVEIRRVDLILPDRLEVDSIVLKSRKDGAVLLSLARGGVAFNFEDLWSRRIGEVRLEQPVIHASPRLPEIFGTQTAATEWTVRHGSDQTPRIGMSRLPEQALRWPDLDQPARIHHADPMCDR